MTKRHWTNQENQIFVDLMPEYRKATYQQSIQTIREVTKDYVDQLRSHPLITDRSQQAVYEHLTYFDDLLEGIGSTDNYGAKDGIYFGKLKSGLRQTQHPCVCFAIVRTIWTPIPSKECLAWYG
jgi:hypothetical protein